LPQDGIARMMSPVLTEGLTTSYGMSPRNFRVRRLSILAVSRCSCCLQRNSSYWFESVRYNLPSCCIDGSGSNDSSAALRRLADQRW
jgi:hypothetical protein